MSRLLIVLIALLLPIQFAWSAASAYCQHEGQSERQNARTSVAASQQRLHFGHHVHAHKANGQSPSPGTLSPDTDCASCHAAEPGVVPALFLLRDFAVAEPLGLAVAATSFSSAPGRAPDRPQWPRLV